MAELLNQRRLTNETTANETFENSPLCGLKTRFPLNSVAEVVEVELALKSNAEFVKNLVKLHFKIFHVIFKIFIFTMN
jgi:hypothetical protein